MENNEAEQKKERRIMQQENRLREFSDSIHIIGVPEEEERQKWAENVFQEIIAENCPNLGKETDIQIQMAQRTSIKINKSRPTAGYTVIKFAKHSDKEKT